MQFIEGPYVADTEFGSITCPTGDLARVYYSLFRDEKVYDNTVRLLAASLEMYEALNAARDGLYAAFTHASRVRDILQPIIAQVEDTIAKVEGRSNAPAE